MIALTIARRTKVLVLAVSVVASFWLYIVFAPFIATFFNLAQTFRNDLTLGSRELLSRVSKRAIATGNLFTILTPITSKYTRKVV
jgi:hypothetical protein